MAPVDAALQELLRNDTERSTLALSTVQKIVNNIPERYMSLLDELGTGSIAQKVTHPLHSDFGRSLRDHFVSCYLLLEAWGNPHVLCAAGLFHAVYQRGDGMRAVDAAKMRPVLRQRLGEEGENLYTPREARTLVPTDLVVDRMCPHTPLLS